MKKQFRKLALAVVFALTVSFIAPAARVVDAATTKTFTYSEQKTSDAVTTLVMDKGEKVDLKFDGVSNWKTYKYKWASSNTKVAVVDSSGVVTAIGTGVATVKLTISGGDGTQYKSTGVTVYVGLDQSIAIGTSTQDEIKSYTLSVGNQVALKPRGLKDNVGDRYEFQWTSTNPEVATVASNGVVTAKENGLTVIMLTAKKTFSGKTMTAVPIALLVGDGAGVPDATATPAPTRKPGATATPTPTPTATPKATATPTPTPIIEAGSYSITVSTDKSITVSFGTKLEAIPEGIELSEVIEADGNDILIKKDIRKMELDDTGKKLTVTAEDVFHTGRYNLKFSENDSGRTFPVSIGVPNRIDIVYSCLGREGMAYAYDDDMGIDVPVQLEYKLYYGNVDVTESYQSVGEVEFELVSPTNSEYVQMDYEQIYFYAAKQTAVVRATYTYYTETGTEKQIKDTASILAKEIGDYTITHVAKWTIIDTTDNSPIDWNNTVNKVIAGRDNFRIVALLADSYGFYYSTDERGVDKANNIYSINDDNTLFAMKGYDFAFNSSNDDDFFIDDNGDLFTYNAKNRVAAYITLYNGDEWSNGERNLGAWQFTIQAESKLNKVEIADTSITLLTRAENNDSRFCTGDVVVKLYDQYNYKWTGDSDLELSSTTSAIDDVIDEVAYLTEGANEGEWILHIDAKAIASETTKSSVSITVTDAETKKKDSITVSLKDPAGSKNDIVVDDWAAGVKEEVITFGDGNLSEMDAQAIIEIYQISKVGGYKVGLLKNGDDDENGNEIKIQLQKNKNQTFKSTNCKIGDVFVLVQKPNGTVVDFADNSGDLGLYQDPGTGEVVFNVTKFNGDTLSYVEEGKYTIKVTKINNITSGGSVSKDVSTASFTVVDNTKDVTIASYNGNRTANSVSGTNDPDIKEIILELFNFELGGVAWSNIDEEMITSVKYTDPVNDRIRITEIEFAVPADGKSGTVTYHKKITLSKTIYINEDE